MPQVDSFLSGKRTNMLNNKDKKYLILRKITANDIINTLKFVNNNYILLQVVLLCGLTIWIQSEFCQE